MRLLGFLFLLLLILAGVGFYQGWFSITTAKAGGKDEVRLEVDSGKIGDDTKAAAARIGELSVKAAAAVKSLGRKGNAGETEIEGVLSSVNLTSHSVTLVAGSESIDMQVGSGVAITRDGESLGFDQLRSAMRARFVFADAADARRLLRIEILR